MTLQSVPGQYATPVGPNLLGISITNPASIGTTLDAANEACDFIGRIYWADGGNHTVSSAGGKIEWRSAAVTFANAGTTVVVGIGTVAGGPPPRATNVADLITTSVSASLTGGGGGITANAWQTSTMSTGSMAINHLAKVAVSVQMTARGGADSVIVTTSSGAVNHAPQVTTFTGGVYTALASSPNAVITADDGTIGWFYASEVFSAITARTFNSGSSPNEYGQLFNLPFPYTIRGVYGWVDPDNDFDAVVYSAPLSGSPVAQLTASFPATEMASNTPRRFEETFPSTYDVARNTDIVVGFKPGASNISAYYKTLGNAAHRAADIWGTSGYGVSRSGGAGAFANANSGLDHYYIGLLISRWDDAAGGGGGGGISRARAAAGF